MAAAGAACIVSTGNQPKGRPCFSEPGYQLNVDSMVGARPYRPL